MSKPFSIRLPEGMTAELDKAAEKVGMTRNGFIVFGLRRMLDGVGSVEAVVAGPSSHVSGRAETKYPGEGRKRSGKTGAVGSTPTAEPHEVEGPVLNVGEPKGPATRPTSAAELAERFPGVSTGAALKPKDCPRAYLHRAGEMCKTCGSTGA